MERAVLVLVIASACYSPREQPGSPCGPERACPSELVCSPATNTCEHTAVDASPGGPWLAGYAFRKRITVMATEKLVSFPVSVLETADPDLAARSTGHDVAFTAADATTVLDHELVSFDTGTGALDAWFLAPSLAPGATFYLYFGGPDRTATSPWDQRFAGVWHMSGSGALVDSTKNHNDAASIDHLPAEAAGLVGAARVYDGVDDTTLCPDANSLDFGIRSFSYSVWVNVPASAGPFDMPMYKGGASMLDAGYDIELGTNNWSAYVGDGVANIGIDFGTETEFLQRWVQLIVVVDRAAGKLRSYVDGKPAASRDLATLGSVDTNNDLSLGHATHLLAGRLDEPRVYAIAIDDAWAAAEYANFASRSTFITLGPVEPR